MNPLDIGEVHAADVEDAFRVAHVLFMKQLLQIQSDITSIKQQQARQRVSSNLIESLSTENDTLKLDFNNCKDLLKNPFLPLFLKRSNRLQIKTLNPRGSFSVRA